MTIEELTAQAERIIDEVERAVVGKREAIEFVLLGILADGHVLIEDFPGLAKTLIARSFARTAGLDFARIQFTPDLMPADVTGSSIYNQRNARLRVQARADLREPAARRRDQPGASEDAGGAARGDAGAAGHDRRPHAHPLEPPFLVLATQNPIEYEGTYPLPEAQLDRFILRMGVGYPSRGHEFEMLDRRLERCRGRGRARAGRRPADAARDAAGGRAGARRGAPSGTTSSTSSPRRVAPPACRSGPVLEARSPCSSSRGAGRRCRGATT